MRSNKTTFVSLALICSFLSPLSVLPFANAIDVFEGPASLQQIIVNDEMLSMDVQNIRLDTILSRIAEQTDIRILFYGIPTQEVTLKLDSVPLENALKRLLKNSSVSFIYSKVKSKAGKPRIVLNEIVIITEKPGAEIVYSKLADDHADSFKAPPAPMIKKGEGPASQRQIPADKPEDRERVYGEGVFVKLAPETSQNMTVHEIFSSSNTITTSLDTDLSRKIDVPADRNGVKIHTVEQGSALETLGLLPDDVVRQINGEAASDASTAESIIRKTLVNKADTTIKMEVERDGVIEPIYIEFN